MAISLLEQVLSIIKTAEHSHLKLAKVLLSHDCLDLAKACLLACHQDGSGCNSTLSPKHNGMVQGIVEAF
jgi:hypothetical protein